MRTTYQYGIRYLENSLITTHDSELAATLFYRSLLKRKIPVELVRRRVTYGVWQKPDRLLINGKTTCREAL